MEIDAAAKKLDNSARLKEMVREDHNDLSGKEAAKPSRPKTDIHTKYKRPNYLYRLL